jgi:HEAT repeat protein
MIIDTLNSIECVEEVEEKLKILASVVEFIKKGGEIPEKEIVGAVLNLFQNKNELIRIKATEISEFLKDELIIDKLIDKMANDESYFVRGFAAKALGSIGNIKARPELEKAVFDSEGFVVSFAGQALKAINIKLSFSSKLDMLRMKIRENN